VADASPFLSISAAAFPSASKYRRAALCLEVTIMNDVVVKAKEIEKTPCSAVRRNDRARECPLIDSTSFPPNHFFIWASSSGASFLAFFRYVPV
jgi:hypothetical protein